jgi:hypothetical protein
MDDDLNARKIAGIGYDVIVLDTGQLSLALALQSWRFPQHVQWAVALARAGTASAQLIRMRIAPEMLARTGAS